MICLDAEFRGKAIAEKLLEKFVGNCFENDYDVISLSVAIDNVRAIAFYRKSGWQVVSRNNESVFVSFQNTK